MQGQYRQIDQHISENGKEKILVLPTTCSNYKNSRRIINGKGLRQNPSEKVGKNLFIYFFNSDSSL